MSDTEDTLGYLSRPRWVVHGVLVAQEAEKNTLIGKLPSDRTGKSMAYLFALMDELGDYRKGTDWSAWNTLVNSTFHILGGGTIPEQGDRESLLYEKTHSAAITSLRHFQLHWVDIPVYMIGAYWRCARCAAKTTWLGDAPEATEDATCSFCGETTALTWKSIRSPWFDDQCEGMGNDPQAIARNLLCDWDASISDRAFFTFRADKVKRERYDVAGWRMFDGFDPGTNEANPAALVVVAFDDEKNIPRVVGYWMARDKPVAWWVPFFKRWRPNQLDRMPVLQGGHAGTRTWSRAYAYSTAELDMMARIARYPLGESWGDRYGQNREASSGMSQYDVLERYGITMNAKKTRDRWALIERARDLWVPRLEIDPAIAELEPANPGRDYPSLVSCFSTARLITTETGQRESVRDINKREPWMVSHPIDAFLYLTNGLPTEVRASVDVSGEYRVESYEPSPVVRWGEGA